MLQNIKIELKNDFFWVTFRYGEEEKIWPYADIYEAFGYLIDQENKFQEKELKMENKFVHDFGWALAALKRGEAVARKGWNGKGMFITMKAGSTVKDDMMRNEPAKNFYGTTDVNIMPHLDMKAADGSYTVGWLASQSDMLSNDWGLFGTPNELPEVEVLILTDVQVDFITGVLANPEAQKKVPAIVEKIRNFNGIIFATHDTHFTKEQVAVGLAPTGIAYEDSLEYKFRGLPAHCIKLTPGWEIHPDVLAELKKKNEDGKYNFHAIDKYTFGYDDWKRALGGYNIKKIHVCGFCSDICDVSQAIILRSLYPNVPMEFDAACSAGVTHELHQAAYKVMESCQIEVINKD